MAAESPPSSLPPPPPPPPPPLPQSQQQQYWCHHCEKRVQTETIPGQPDVICSECKFGFVETIPGFTTAVFPPSPSLPPDLLGGIDDERTLGSQFLHVLRLIAQVARDDHPAPPPPPPPPRAASDDFLRIEIDDSWRNHAPSVVTEREFVQEDDDQHNDDQEDGNEEVDDDDDDEEDVRSVEIEGESDDDSDNGDGEEREIDEVERRRQRTDVLRLRLRDFAARARTGGGRNRILDWAEILMGLEDNSIEFRFEMPADRYIGDPGDYVDAAEYDALLQNLADAEGRRGAPPAAKEAVDALKVVVIKEDNRVGYEEGSYVCAICKDGVSDGDVVKEMPCGHGYHGDCIVPWLAARNSCPVCRFELPTEDAEYEEEKRKRSSSGGGGSVTGDGSSAIGSSSLA